MRIGLVVYGGLDRLSGGYLYDRRLKESLEAAGDEVLVFPQPSGAYGTCLLHNLPPRSGDFLRRIRRERLDALLEDELNHPSLFLLNQALAGRVRLAAVVHHLRSSEPRSRIANAGYGAVERLFLRGMDGYVVNSRHTLGAIRRLVPEDRPHVLAQPAGDRLGSLSEKDIEGRLAHGGELRLLYLGALIRRKGLCGLLAALGRLPLTTPWRLTVAGCPEAEPGYARQAASLAARLPAGRVRFLGRVEDKALPDLLASHHVLAMPFAFEGFGIALAEAMAFGLPCLASTEGGAPGLVRHGESGLLLRPGDLAGAAQAVARLARDSDHLRLLSLGARRAYSLLPTWEECGRRVRRFLEDLGRERNS